MPIEITMPRLSDTMEEGALIKWNVNVGDKVTSGDILADVETDKATVELQTLDDGIVAALVAEEGATLPVGGLIAVLAEEGETVEEVASAVTGAAQAPARQTSAITDGPPTQPSPTASTVTHEQLSGEHSAAAAAEGARLLASPVARKIAEEKGVDLDRVIGTGPGGRIIKRDVLAAAQGGGPALDEARPTPSPIFPASEVDLKSAPPMAATSLEAKDVPLGNMRKTMARRLVESKTTIPHFTVTIAVDTQALTDLRRSINAALQADGVKLSVNDFIVRACALALVKHPALNASWADEVMRLHGTVNMGVAVALPQEKGGGLVVPTIRDAQSKGLRQISAETRALAKKARERGLAPQDMGDGTFTVSNLGMFGVERVEAIINPPQAAILAVGAAIETPVVRAGQIVVGQQMGCTLSADHRIVDGTMAADFLQTFKLLLENPAGMLV